ncbi:hypothetical protein, partial [Ferrovibrio terrae]|uniref:hypothetical protein n=1 Tax=Ferrovibrio terrae TaxID=2594003 RepID=UPI00313820B5
IGGAQFGDRCGLGLPRPRTLALAFLHSTHILLDGRISTAVSDESECTEEQLRMQVRMSRNL